MWTHYYTTTVGGWLCGPTVYHWGSAYDISPGGMFQETQNKNVKDGALLKKK